MNTQIQSKYLKCFAAFNKLALEKLFNLLMINIDNFMPGRLIINCASFVNFFWSRGSEKCKYSHAFGIKLINHLSHLSNTQKVDSH